MDPIRFYGLSKKNIAVVPADPHTSDCSDGSDCSDAENLEYFGDFLCPDSDEEDDAEELQHPVGVDVLINDSELEDSGAEKILRRKNAQRRLKKS